MPKSRERKMCGALDEVSEAGTDSIGENHGRS
jgi:hypothetical protein